jgi:hypothetical protein
VKKAELNMKHFLTLLLVISAVLVSLTASADEKVTLTVPSTTIVGHPQRPTASIEVSRVRMQLGATTPTLASVTKIHDAAKKDPF